MTAAKWRVDSNQSDVLFKARHSIIAYLGNSINEFNGSIVVTNDELTDASVEFVVDVNKKKGKLEHIYSHLKLNDVFNREQYPTLS